MQKETIDEREDRLCREAADRALRKRLAAEATTTLRQRRSLVFDRYGWTWREVSSGQAEP